MTYTSITIRLEVPICGTKSTREKAGLPGPPDEACVEDYCTDLVGAELANNIFEIFLDELHPHWRVEAEKAILVAAAEDATQAETKKECPK